MTVGVSAAVALGVPLGAIIGQRFGWRATFGAVASLSILALAGLLIGLPRGMGSGLSIPGFHDRIAVVRQRGGLAALLTTTLWATAAYTVYTFISPYLGRVVHLTGTSAGSVLFLYGAAAFVGLLFGGTASDRLGVRPVIVAELCVMAAALASLYVVGRVSHAGPGARTGAAIRHDLGFCRVGLFPGSTKSVDRDRRGPGRIDYSIFERIVHVSRLRAWRHSRLDHSQHRRDQ